MAPSHPTVTTNFLLANIHCPTCVSSIKDALQHLPGISWVSPNVVTSWVAVEHDPNVSITEMASKLESAGFEVSSIASTNGEAALANLLLEDPTGIHGRSDTNNSSNPSIRDSPLGRIIKLPRRFAHAQASSAAAEKEHLNNCGMCRTKGVKGTRLSVLGPKCCGTSSEKDDSQSGDQSVNDQKAIPGIVASTKSLTIEDEKPQPPSSGGRRWRASMAINGMVCAACVAPITSELSKRQWITKYTISHLLHSGVIEYIGTEDDVKQIIEMIEDTGKDVELHQVINIDGGENRPKQERTVQIRIDGFYCDHCAERATNSLRGFLQDVEITCQPTRQRPILEISYVPIVPNFTIRRILSAIEASDPAFKASIYHPPTLEERTKRIHARQQNQFRIRAWFTTIVVIPTFIIGVVYMSLVPEHNPSKMFLMKPWRPGISRAQLALCIMATPVYFFAADIFHRRAVKEIRSLWRRGSTTGIFERFYRFGSMNTLISLGTTIAYISSISQMIAAAVDHPNQVNDANFYFDSVVFLTFFLLWGRLIEAYTKSKTGDAVEALGKLRPTTAVLVEDVTDKHETETVINTDLLEFGDLVRVPYGASPPCDGKIVLGETTFDESSLTGESRPVAKVANDDVFAGTVNVDKPILIQITGSAGKSMLDQIVNIVREGQNKQAPMEALAETLTAYFVPFVTLIAILTWLIWLSVGLSGVIPGHFLDVSSGGWVVFSLQFAIAVFVVACPCGLALAAPTAIFVGGGLAAKHGILVKEGGEAFEKASRIDCVVFDKTGTLTVGGKPTITDSMIFPGLETTEQQRNTLLGALRAIEENSSHPIANAIVSFCKTQTSERVEIASVEEIPGKGLKATYSSGSPLRSFEIIIGNESLMRDFAAAIPLDVTTNLDTWKREAKSVALVALKVLEKPTAVYNIAAALSISDPIRPETPAVIQALKAGGTDVWMLSGDNATTAKVVASRIGIPETNVIAEVLPAQKHEKIKWLQSTLKARRGNLEITDRRAMVAMVGDGINDAPALSTADVGIAIGSGSDVAIFSADFVLVNSNLESVVTLLDLSRAVFRRIKFNFAWALVYNLLAVPVAAGCFYALMVNGQHVRLPPVWASLAMALSSISVVASSLALRSELPGVGFKIRVVAPERNVQSENENGLRIRNKGWA
ncbi:heavy metal translocatin [Hypoxylon trugodes]|uniref:heavy metal translocatin n=1 Tax=Hypoxylon trugodes TaxID=326681 RepID=UPI00219931ED|nr:heavy metal translocatin [Hypoxylon trugodes]KAI1387241.1 heavy metal translocatin [Hypoxylon trugodes]